MSLRPEVRQVMPASRPRHLTTVLAVPAALGLALGVLAVPMYLGEYLFADVQAYYDAAARLNAGLPLYANESGDHRGLYLYPPLLAVLFRPLALLPFPVAASIWQVMIIVAFALVLRRIGLRPPVVLALAALSMPVVWALSIGQAEVVVTLLLTYASPFTVAAAGHLKLAPLLVAVWWAGRREFSRLARLVTWTAVLALAQFVVEPSGTLAYLRLEWLQPALTVGGNLSPYAVHPVLWVVLVGIVGLLALRFAGTRWGWPLALALSIVAYPRLLAYQLITLLAGFATPGVRGARMPEGQQMPTRMGRSISRFVD